MTPEIYKLALERDTVLLRAIEIAKGRKDIWPSRAAAREWFAKRLPWRRWDPRVLDLYVVCAELRGRLPSVTLILYRNTDCVTYRLLPTLIARLVSLWRRRVLRKAPATAVTKTASRAWRGWSNSALQSPYTRFGQGKMTWCTLAVFAVFNI